MSHVPCDRRRFPLGSRVIRPRCVYCSHQASLACFESRVTEAMSAQLCWAFGFRCSPEDSAMNGDHLECRAVPIQVRVILRERSVRVDRETGTCGPEWRNTIRPCDAYLLNTLRVQIRRPCPATGSRGCEALLYRQWRASGIYAKERKSQSCSVGYVCLEGSGR